MTQPISQNLDIELGPRDVQALSNADAVAAFFARLGYSTDRRTQQTPANLGITADGTARPIKKIELIADQENLFQVYLLELTSVTGSPTLVRWQESFAIEPGTTCWCSPAITSASTLSCWKNTCR